MKIAYLSVFYPYRGGISQFNACVYRALEKKHEVKAYTFTRQYPDILFPGKTQYVNESDSADPIPAERLLDSINPFSYMKTAKEIKKFKPDLMLLQNWMPFFAPSLGYVAKQFKKMGIPTISIMANVKPHESKPGDDFLNNYYFKRNHGYVMLAEAVKRDLLSYKPDAKYFYHPHPNYEHFGEKIDKQTARKILDIPQDKKVVIYFGLVRHYKGLDILMNAISEMDEDIFLLAAGEIYGKGEEYHELASNPGLKNRSRVDFKYLNDDEVALYFSAADLCVLPYRTATQSGIVGISYHFGVPVISTDVGGLKEVIEPFGTGLVIDKADKDLLKSAIEKYFNENMQEKCQANISSFKAKYTWDSLADGIVNFYKEIKNSL